MTLTIRKIIVLSCIGLILLLGIVLAVATWLADKGIVDTANWVRAEFLTGTAIAVIVALLILLVNPKSGRAAAFGRKCPVRQKAFWRSQVLR